MEDEMRAELIIQMTRAIDALLLTWEPNPTLKGTIAAQIQSLAGVISATTDPGPALSQVKNNLGGRRHGSIAAKRGRTIQAQLKAV
jgi:hypothetical protein